MLAAEQCSLGIKASLRDGLLRKLFALGPAYTGRERTGNIASTISSKVEYLNEYYTIYLPAAISAVVNAVLIVSTLFLFNRPSAWTCLTGCLGMLGLPDAVLLLMRKRGEAEMQAHAQYYSDCLDSVQGMSTLKAFNANGRQKEAIYQKGERLRQAVMGQLRVTMLETWSCSFSQGLAMPLPSPSPRISAREAIWSRTRWSTPCFSSAHASRPCPTSSTPAHGLSRRGGFLFHCRAAEPARAFVASSQGGSCR